MPISFSQGLTLIFLFLGKKNNHYKCYKAHKNFTVPINLKHFENVVVIYLEEKKLCMSKNVVYEAIQQFSSCFNCYIFYLYSEHTSSN